MPGPGRCSRVTVARPSESVGRLIRRLFAAVLTLAAPVLVMAAPPPLTAGIDRALAQWRADRVTDVRYRIDARLSSALDRLHLDVEAEVAIAQGGEPLVFDWRPEGGAGPTLEARVNGRIRHLAITGGHVLVEGADVVAGRNVVTFSVVAPVSTAGGPLTRYHDSDDGADYVYTLLVPADASTVFPCFDQPDLKARFTLTLRTPADWIAVANAPPRESRVEAGEALHAFDDTAPISTYLFAFAAGPFAAFRVDGDATTLYVRRSRRALGEVHAAPVLDANRQAIAWLSHWLDQPFPFPKYDLVVLPEFAYGGMEHAGATFLREAAVLFSGPPSAVETFRRAHLIFHETAHQWLGDLVTMRWFDDLWLKEGFANFAAARIAESAMPQADPWVAFQARKAEAVRIDGSPGTAPIRQPLDDLLDAKSSYGPVVYEKAPALLRQLEFALGESAFRDGVRAWVRARAFAATDAEELVLHLGQAAGRDLSSIVGAWLDVPGLPEVRVVAAAAGQVRIRVEAASSAGTHWSQRLRLRAFRTGQPPCDADFDLDGAAADVALPAACTDAEVLLLNAGDFGYGRFRLRADEREAALRWASIAPESLDRALLWEALWEEVRDTDLAPEAFVAAIANRLGHEPSALLEAQLLARVEGAWRAWLTPVQRVRQAPRLEAALLAIARDSDDLSRRIGAQRAYAVIATTEPARARVRAWLAGEEIPPAPWRAREAFAAARALSAWGTPPDASALAQAMERVRAGDDAARFLYAARAAAPSPDVKRDYVERWLHDPTVPEAWIEEALGGLNDPDHHDATRALFAAALEALRAFAATRRIFFVNRWLDAFAGGQRSPEALDALARAAEDERLPAALRDKLRLAQDGLARTLRIRARWAAP